MRTGRLICAAFLFAMLTPTARAQLLDCSDKTTGLKTTTYSYPNAENLIVFVHGLCGDATTTWLNNGSSSSFLFPQQVAQSLQSDVMSFDYSSSLVGSPRIDEIAKLLDAGIQRQEGIKPHRTIQFVAHSMGGLVVRDYIAYYYLLDRSRRFRVTTIVSLAAPYRGSTLANYASHFRSDRQLEELKTGGNSWLQTLNDLWNRQFRSNMGPQIPLRLYAGWEDQPVCFTSHWGWSLVNPCMKIVDKDSAVDMADDDSPFEKNHIDIAKPVDATDQVYEWVTSKLKEGNEWVLAKFKGQDEQAMAHVQQLVASPTNTGGTQSSAESTVSLDASSGRGRP